MLCLRSIITLSLVARAALAQQSSAVWCRAPRALRCGTVRCCAVLRAVLHILCRAYQVAFGIIQQYSEVQYIRFVRTTLLNHSKCSHLSSAQLSNYTSAARSAVRCRAVPCCAVLSFEHTTVPGTMRSTRYQVPVRTCVYSSFCFLH